MRAKRFQREAQWLITRRNDKTYLTGGPANESIRIVQIVLPNGRLAGAVLPEALGDLAEPGAVAAAADLLILAGFIRQTYNSEVDVFNMPTANGPVGYLPKQDGGQGKTCVIKCVWLTQAAKLTTAGVCFRGYLRWRYRHTRGKTLYAAQLVTTAAIADYQAYVEGLPRAAWQRWSQELERIELHMEVLVKTAGVTNKTRQVMLDDWLDQHWNDYDPAVACAVAWRERSINTLRKLHRVNKAISRYMEFAPYAAGFFHQFPDVLAAFKEGESLRNIAYTTHYRTVLKPAAMQQLQSL